MGLRFRKSVKIAPGVRMNFGKNGTSVSIGGKGYRKTFSSTGRTTTSVGIPGTGISYSTTKSGKKKPSKKAQTFDVKFQDANCAENSRMIKPAASKYRTYGIIIQVLAVLLLIFSLSLANTEPVAIIPALFACFLFYVGMKYKKKQVPDDTAKTENTDEDIS